MKKITCLLMMLMSITAFSQIEVVENFDDAPNNGQLAGWTDENFSTSSSAPCSGSGLSELSILDAGLTASLTTPNYTAISNGTNLDVSFDFNVFEIVFGFPPAFNAPPEGWGSIVLEYSTDNGSNWVTVTTIDDSVFNFTGQTECVSTGTISVGTIADGSDFQARFSVNNVSDTRLYFTIDNVSITQTPTTIPNCDAMLTSPVDGSSESDIDTTLNWQAATGFADGYKISVGTTPGGTDIVNADTTMDTSYSLTGLEYETEYFVSIVSFNSFGDATNCTEESFTTRLEPIAGATCSNPITVSTFPYLEQNGDTNNYEDNIDTSPCSNSYMNGKDVFYEITPTTDVSINIDLLNISNNGASIHVVEGCPDTATTCVDYVGVFNSGGSLSLSEIVLTGGNTYFIVLSNSGSTRTYTYDLIIDQNDCINPAMSLTAVEDCGSGQFNVDVDVTYLGAASSLTLSDNISGVLDANITTTGIVNVGPYPSGTVVDFTLTNNDDSSCFFDDSTFFYCPPSNDECVDSIVLPVNTDENCTTVTSATNAGATQSTANPTTCGPGSNPENNFNDVWFSFVATTETTVLEYLNKIDVLQSGGNLMTTELMEGTCGTLTSLGCKSGDYITLSGLTIGNTYYLRNYTNLSPGYAQSFDVCLRELPPAPANDECSNATPILISTDDLCNNQISGSTIGATLSSESTCETDATDVWYTFNPAEDGIYEFTFNYTGTLSYFFIYSGNCGALIEESTSCTSNSNQILTLDSTETYYVMVRSRDNGPGADFDLCVYQLPDAVSNNDCATPDTILESEDFNGNNSISGNMENSYPSAENCNTSRDAVWYTFTPSLTGMYNFEFTRVSGSASFAVFNGDDCSNLTQDIAGLTSCFMSGSRSGELVAGNNYLVSVHASSAAEFELFVYPDPSLSTGTAEFETFKYYPNPVKNVLTIEANSSISKVTIHNTLGQQIKLERPNTLQTEVNLSEIKKGIYFVTVSINNSQKTFRVIKE